MGCPQTQQRRMSKSLSKKRSLIYWGVQLIWILGSSPPPLPLFCFYCLGSTRTEFLCLSQKSFAKATWVTDRAQCSHRNAIYFFAICSQRELFRFIIVTGPSMRLRNDCHSLGTSTLMSGLKVKWCHSQGTPVLRLVRVQRILCRHFKQQRPLGPACSSSSSRTFAMRIVRKRKVCNINAAYHEPRPRPNRTRSCSLCMFISVVVP